MTWTGRIDDSGPVVPAGLHDRDTEGDSEGTRRPTGFPRNPVDMALVLSIVLLLVGAVAVAINLWHQI
jgi:hypothetical protein